MNISEFRKKVKAGKKLYVDDKEFTIEQVIKFRFDDGDFYIKCFLSDGYVFADDLEENTFLLVKEVKTNIKEPFPKNLSYDNKEFDFLYNAHAMAEETEGKNYFKKGESESFSDYEAKDGSYLSLGKLDKTGERLDFYGKTIKPKDVRF